VFNFVPPGTLTTLHTFSGSDGLDPIGLVQGSDSNLYGLTSLGGSSSPTGQGSVFKLTLGSGSSSGGSSSSSSSGSGSSSSGGSSGGGGAAGILTLAGLGFGVASRQRKSQRRR
jgi:hypothetical protein